MASTAELAAATMAEGDNKTTRAQDEAAAVESDTETLLQGVDEKKLLRKLDLHIIPLVMGLYLFSFLDR
jgi:hypothetical protein